VGIGIWLFESNSLAGFDTGEFASGWKVVLLVDDFDIATSVAVCELPDSTNCAVPKASCMPLLISLQGLDSSESLTKSTDVVSLICLFDGIRLIAECISVYGVFSPFYIRYYDVESKV
jgi:hypothetical protein